MGSIYSKAWRVIVWLGEGSEESDHAMDFLTKLAELGPRLSVKPLHGGGNSKKIGWIQNQSSFKGIEWSGEEAVWDTVEEMFFRTYWNRVWIVQEIILGVDVRVCCGSKMVPWDVFFCDARKLDNKNGSLPKPLQHSMPAKLHFQRQFKRRQTYTLLRMLITWKDSLSSDPRDKIFGFLGIADACSDGQVKADYSKTSYEVFMDTSKFLRENVLSSEIITTSALVYSSIGSPIPAPEILKTLLSNSFPVIGHILSVKKNLDSIENKENASVSLDISLPKHIFNEISSPDSIASLYPCGIRPASPLEWSPNILPSIQPDCARRAGPGQTTCVDHWPLFLDTEGTGHVSEDIVSFSCFLFECRTIFLISLTNQLVIVNHSESKKICEGHRGRGYLPTDNNFGRLYPECLSTSILFN